MLGSGRAARVRAGGRLARGRSGREAQEPQDLVVQSTTSVRDSGLLEQVIVPEFQREYPQWRLKVVAVGTGQAITNARAGQGDVLITHAPALEAQFVADGFSLEPAGRTIMWNDFVVVGPPGDPAGVAAAGGHDAAAAFEAIAAAGAAGRATFVSRGDNSGTNTKEKDIWKLTGVARNASNEPAGSGAANPPWYTKAGLGMADTLRLTQQCPSGGCYTITDRGTLQQLISNGAITALPIAMEQQDAAARGGSALMINQYRGYGLNPAKVPAAKTEGALAFLDFLTSRDFQDRLRALPHARSSRASSRPRSRSCRLTRRPPQGDLGPAHAHAAREDRLRGPRREPARQAPGVRLSRFTSPLTARTLARRHRRRGDVPVRWKPDRSGRLFLTTPRFRDLSPLRLCARRGSRPRRRPAAQAARPRRSGAAVRPGVAGDRPAARAAGGARPAGRGRPVPGSAACPVARRRRQPLQARRRARAGSLGRARALRRPRHRGGGTISPGGPSSSADRGGWRRSPPPRSRRPRRTPRASSSGWPTARRGSTRPRCATPPTWPRAPTRCAGRAAPATPSPIRPPYRCRGVLELAGVSPDALSFVSIRRANGTLTVLGARRPRASRSVSGRSAAGLARRRQRPVPPARPRRC